MNKYKYQKYILKCKLIQVIMNVKENHSYNNMWVNFGICIKIFHNTHPHTYMCPWLSMTSHTDCLFSAIKFCTYTFLSESREKARLSSDNTPSFFLNTKNCMPFNKQHSFDTFTLGIGDTQLITNMCINIILRHFVTVFDRSFTRTFHFIAVTKKYPVFIKRL